MDKCYMCGRYGRTERHHIFGGANRKHSEEDGLVVRLCHFCHNEPPNGVHFNKGRMDALREKGQEMYEEKLISEGKTREEARVAFIKRYGKNYIP